MAFGAGQTIFEEESPAGHLYIVSEGSVELRFTVTHYAALHTASMDRKFKGDMLGWSAVVAPHAYILTAIAVKDSKLLKVSGSDIQRLCTESDRFGHAFMRNLAHVIGQRLNITQRMLIGVIQDHLKKREPGE
ncbi:MAG: cyclic nucleotide-binding domain-containing protein [bacterium]|nr:cyclic nucleotide-binding domain-containing protein [bacterium]